MLPVGRLRVAEEVSESSNAVDSAEDSPVFAEAFEN